MSNFPLYDNFAKGISKKDLTASQKGDFTKKIKNIDTIGAELIYALIKVYQIQNDKNTVKLPYEGKRLKTGMKFDLELFPKELKQILYKFLLTHVKKMEEDSIMNENREDITSLQD